MLYVFNYQILSVKKASLCRLPDSIRKHFNKTVGYNCNGGFNCSHSTICEE